MFFYQAHNIFPSNVKKMSICLLTYPEITFSPERVDETGTVFSAQNVVLLIRDIMRILFR